MVLIAMSELLKMTFPDYHALSAFGWKFGILYVHEFKGTPDTKLIHALEHLERCEFLIGIDALENEALYKGISPPPRRPAITSWIGNPIAGAYTNDEVPEMKISSRKHFMQIYLLMSTVNKLSAEWQAFGYSIQQPSVDEFWFEPLLDTERTRFITVKEAEERRRYEMTIGGQTVSRPFGSQFDDWQELQDAMQPGDELVEYTSSQKLWDQHMGMTGIRLVRSGKVIKNLITALN